jgi:integrase
MPCFGQRRLCDITKLDVQQFVADKFRQGLAWQTVRKAWIVLWKRVRRSSGLQLPEFESRSRRKVASTGLAERDKDSECDSTGVLTALTGLRVGELLALRWKMVDLTAGTMRISESVFHGQVQPPKSERSVRVIPIGPQTRLLLEEHRMKAGTKWNEEGLVFPSKFGGPLRESNLLERVLTPAAEVAGLGRVTWHQLRHIHASTLHDIGIPAKIAQLQLGTLVSRPR